MAAGSGPGSAKSEQLRADICREQAVSARVARDYDAARGLLAEARGRYQRLGLRVGVANTQRELGAVLDRVGDSPGARRDYFRAFAAYLRAGRRIGAAAVARRVGELDLVTGLEEPAALARAGRRFAQAIRLGRGELTNAARTTLSQGRLARLLGDLDAAERLLDKAVQMYAGAGVAQDAARGLSEAALEYGLVARDQGEHEKAAALFREALGALREADDPGPASLAQFHLALELIQAGEVTEALRHAVASFELDEADGRRLQDPAERRSFYRDNSATYGLAMHCAAEAGDGRAAFTIAMAARSEALTAFVRAGARLDPGLRDLIDEIALANAEAGPRTAGDNSQATPPLEQLYARLEHRTSLQMRQAMTGKGADLDEVIATLPGGGHALMLDVLEEDDTICQRVWVSPAGEITADEVLLQASVRRFLDSYHEARERAAWYPQQDELAGLGRAVLPPGLAAALGTGTNPPLVVSTGGLLSPVPVAALRVNDRYLAEQAQLALVPSMALWAALRARPARAGRGTLAFLDPALPSSPREAAALRAALAPVRQVGSRQLREDLADASQYAAVVISAHGTAPAARPGLGKRKRHARWPSAGPRPRRQRAADRRGAAHLPPARRADHAIVLVGAPYGARCGRTAGAADRRARRRRTVGTGRDGGHRGHHYRFADERVLLPARRWPRAGGGAAARSDRLSPVAPANRAWHLGGPGGRGGRIHAALGPQDDKAGPGVRVAVDARMAGAHVLLGQRVRPARRSPGRAGRARARPPGRPGRAGWCRCC